MHTDTKSLSSKVIISVTL